MPLSSSCHRTDDRDRVTNAIVVVIVVVMLLVSGSGRNPFPEIFADRGCSRSRGNGRIPATPAHHHVHPLLTLQIEDNVFQGIRDPAPDLRHFGR